MTESQTPENTPADEPVVESTPEAAAPAEVAVADESIESIEAVVAVPMRHVDARNPIWTVGRRKASTARIRLFPGGGNFMVNGKPLEEFFRLVQDQRLATVALDHAGLRKKYDVWVNVHGGGTTGQSGAIALGVARALIEIEPGMERDLRDASLLRRDARVKERKKYGRRGARRGFQFSKR